MASVVAPEVMIPRPGEAGLRPLLRAHVTGDVSVLRWLAVLARRLMSVVLGAGWALSLVMSRVYDRKVLRIGVEEYKRVANSSLRYWGLVAIVCFLAHIELARGSLRGAY